ncbi:hypothetical protein CLCR_00745 [Cladophialophora carrionii]|uniref:Uncharacterized protein n=1 Tax=Cladophialophora carrionii TaxID=86049 RepID=A0A1C1C6H3_9EURO|nr:hypothetical protein CLCR_00745 [Cladophialophora carrionii]
MVCAKLQYLQDKIKSEMSLKLRRTSEELTRNSYIMYDDVELHCDAEEGMCAGSLGRCHDASMNFRCSGDRLFAAKKQEFFTLSISLLQH